MQGDIAARSNVELRNGIAVGEDLDDRSIRAVLSGGRDKEEGNCKGVTDPEPTSPRGLKTRILTGDTPRTHRRH